MSNLMKKENSKLVSNYAIENLIKIDFEINRMINSYLTETPEFSPEMIALANKAIILLAK